MKATYCCAAALVVIVSTLAQAGDCCQHCGCQADCQKVCRLVCETKKVPKVTYSCKCEDFCVPGPSDRTVCHDCDCCKKQVVYTPTCAEVKTKKVLLKSETMEEVPSYKWVVETVCCDCARQCAQETSAVRAHPDQIARVPQNDTTLANHQLTSHTQPAGPGVVSQASTALKSQLQRVFDPATKR